MILSVMNKELSPKLISLLLSTIIVAILWLLNPVWNDLEDKSYDLRLKTIAKFGLDRNRTSGEIIVVGINDATSLQHKPLIFWYPELARLLTAASAAGARGVGFDIIPFHSLGTKLQEVMDGIPGVDGHMVGSSLGEQLDRQMIFGIISATDAIKLVQGVNGDVVPFYYGMMAHMNNVFPASLKVSYDPDGTIRLQAGQDDDGTERFVKVLSREIYPAAKPVWPVLVNYALLDRIPVIDLLDIVKGDVPPAQLKDKTLILGLISRHEDMHRTPLGQRPGVLVHAAALETIITGSAFHHVAKSVSLVTFLLLSLIGYRLTCRRSPLTALLWSLALVLSFYLLDLLLFATGRVLPLFPHLVAPFAVLAITYPYRYLVKERDRKKLFETFSYYVDPGVIETLITKNPRTLMSGERQQVSIMFLDIRDFTRLSNLFGADVVVSLLNHIFGRFTEIIQSHGGFVNKLIGDGMLAFFPGADHVDNSLAAAEEISASVRQMELSGELATMIADWHLAIGIGIHSGPVILGNIGSKRKMDFTVIGPTVNLASRVESLTKHYARQIIVTSAAKSMATKRFRFEPLGMAEVRGFADGIEIYAMLIADNPEEIER